MASNNKISKSRGEHSSPEFILQIGSFKTLHKAKLLKNNYNIKGYDAFIRSADISEEKDTWYRVFIGGFTEKELAFKAQIKLKQIDGIDSIIKESSLN